MRVNSVGSHKFLQIGTALAPNGDPSLGPHWLLTDPAIWPTVAIANIFEGMPTLATTIVQEL